MSDPKITITIKSKVNFEKGFIYDNELILDGENMELYQIANGKIHPEILNLVTQLVANALANFVRKGEEYGIYEENLTIGEMLQKVKEEYIRYKDVRNNPKLN